MNFEVDRPKNGLTRFAGAILLIVLLTSAVAIAGSSKMLQHKVFAQENPDESFPGDSFPEEASSPDGGGSEEAMTTSDTSPTPGCHPSTEACSVTDILLNDDNSVLCDPAMGSDCSQFLNPQTQEDKSAIPLPEFSELTQDNPDAQVLDATDPPNQYCNPRVETCDPSTVTPDGCMTDVTTHGSICDFSSPNNSTEPTGGTGPSTSSPSPSPSSAPTQATGGSSPSSGAGSSQGSSSQSVGDTPTRGVPAHLCQEALFSHTYLNEDFPLLKKGDRDPPRHALIVELNEYFIIIGFEKGMSTVVFDDNTESAVKQFQQTKNLEQTGTMTKETWDAICYPMGSLHQYGPPTSPLIVPVEQSGEPSNLCLQGEHISTGNADEKYPLLKKGDTLPVTMIEYLRDYLAILGLSSEYPLLQGASFNDDTEAALKQFQHRKNLEPTGTLTKETWSAICQLGYIPGQTPGGGEASPSPGSPSETPGETPSAPPSNVQGCDATLLSKYPLIKACPTQGPLVKQLQEILQYMDYFKADITGFYGPITTEAVKNFQEDNKITYDLKVTGDVDSNTWKALCKEITIESQEKGPGMQLPPSCDPSSRTLKHCPYSDVTAALQQGLKTLGFYTGEVDGYYGPLTTSAVKSFQKRNQIDVDGEAGKDTWTKLCEVGSLPDPDYIRTTREAS